jgi:PhnB protein
VHSTEEAIRFYAQAFGAVNAGASVVRPLKDQFYGERSGTVRDPFGHEWLLGGHLEQMSTAEMQRRYTALFQK